MVKLPKTKVCTKCGKRKKLEAFSCRAANRDGRRSQCKACDAAYGRLWVEDGRSAEYQRVRRRARADEYRARDRLYYAANREKCIAATRAWQLRNKEKVAAQKARYYAENRDKRAAWKQRNRVWINVQQQLRRIGGF